MDTPCRKQAGFGSARWPTPTWTTWRSCLAIPKSWSSTPRPKTRAQAPAWIEWNQRNYIGYGFGLWVVETLDGGFVGDCGLTWQKVDGIPAVEVGYHVRAGLQGRGYASEAATACQDFARGLGTRHLVATIDPANAASQRVAEKIGLTFELTTTASGQRRLVFGADL